MPTSQARHTALTQWRPATKHPNSPSALSFLHAGSSLPAFRRRVATALPRTARRIGLTATVSEPSPGTPLGSRRVLLRPHSPTTAFHAVRPRAIAGNHVPAENRPRAVLRMTKHSAFTSTWPTKPGTGLPNPEAAVAPALAPVFDPEVTSLRRFIPSEERHPPHARARRESAPIRR